VSLGRRKAAWIVGALLLAIGVGTAVAYLANRSEYERFASAPACEVPSMPSSQGCYSDLPAHVVSASESPGGAHSPPSGVITVTVAGEKSTVEPVNGDDTTQFKAGDSITARVWRSQIVSLKSASGPWVDGRNSPAASNAALEGVALAGIVAGAIILGMLIITRRKGVEERRASS
jgi:hypothetical protein